MLSYALLTSRVNVFRRSAIVVSGTAAQTMTVALQPARRSVLQVRVSAAGSTQPTGTVYVTGSVPGSTHGSPASTVTEAVVYTGIGLEYQQTKHMFRSIAGVTTSGLADETPPPNVEIQTVGADGSPQAIAAPLITGWPAALPPQRTTWPADSGGGRTEVDNREAIMPWAAHWSPRPGDIIEDDQGLSWQVQRAPRLAGTYIAQFWLVSLVRYEPP